MHYIVRVLSALDILVIDLIRAIYIKVSSCAFSSRVYFFGMCNVLNNNQIQQHKYE